MTSLEQLKQDYTDVIPVVVKWGEMDAFQHVNNTVYIRYVEDGRLGIFERIGMEKDFQATNKGPILASINCDYLAPVTYPDTLWVASNIKQISPKKITLEQVIYSEKLGKLAAKCNSLCVYYDYSALRSCEVTESINQALQEINS